MIECYYMCQSDNGSITESHAIRQWSNAYINSLDGIKDARAPLQLQSMLTAAGFVDIESQMIPLPLCAWSSGMLARSSTGTSCLEHLSMCLPRRSIVTLQLTHALCRSKTTADWECKQGEYSTSSSYSRTLPVHSTPRHEVGGGRFARQSSSC